MPAERKCKGRALKRRNRWRPWRGREGAGGIVPAGRKRQGTGRKERGEAPAGMKERGGAWANTGQIRAVVLGIGSRFALVS